jgi:hypothetical protein
MNIDKKTYDLFSKAIYHTLKKNQPLTYTQIVECIMFTKKGEKLHKLKNKSRCLTALKRITPFIKIYLSKVFDMSSIRYFFYLWRPA